MRISSKGMARAMPKIKKPPSTSCIPCHEGKQMKTRFPTKEYYIANPLDVIYVDLCDPMRIKSLQGDMYFFMITNDYSIIYWIGSMKEKLDDFEKFKVLMELVENKISRTIKCLRLDRDGPMIDMNSIVQKWNLKTIFNT